MPISFCISSARRSIDGAAATQGWPPGRSRHSHLIGRWQDRVVVMDAETTQPIETLGSRIDRLDVQVTDGFVAVRGDVQMLAGHVAILPRECPLVAGPFPPSSKNALRPAMGDAIMARRG